MSVKKGNKSIPLIVNRDLMMGTEQRKEEEAKGEETRAKTLMEGWKVLAQKRGKKKKLTKSVTRNFRMGLTVM